VASGHGVSSIAFREAEREILQRRLFVAIANLSLCMARLLEEVTLIAKRVRVVEISSS